MKQLKVNQLLLNTIILNTKLFITIVLTSFVLLSSCSQTTQIETTSEPQIFIDPPIKPKSSRMHQYGGWSCPDNLNTFPAIDVMDIADIEVINGRLPTKEETMSGASLMYVDSLSLTSAHALDMTFPRLARCFSDYTKKNELIVVIQGLVSEKDTVVGFRYLNGGNGSAWLHEVQFLSDEEVNSLGTTPFISFKADVDASKGKIFDVLTLPLFAKELGNSLGENAMLESEWKNKSTVQFKNGSGEVERTGMITAFWKDMYIQVDYNDGNQHYVEKMLMIEDEGKPTTEFQFTAGPFYGDYDVQKVKWDRWFKKVIELSEKNSEIKIFK